MSKQVEDGVNGAVEGRGALRPRTARADKLRPKRHQPIEPIDIKVHVAFRQCIGAQDTAFLLAEVLRHVMFMRGQLPMPYRQLLETLEKREGLDRIARERRASRTVDEHRQGGSSFAPRSAATTSRGRKSPKNQRPLSKALAHRRACKTLEALEATVLHMEQAFVDAAQKGRTVREALILLGASHLSPRELYTVVFLPPMGCPVDGSSGAQDPRVPDAYSRKLVRCLVGEMWGASLRNLGPCRVHVFLRLAEGFAAPRRMQAAAAVTAGRDSVAGDPIPREPGRHPRPPPEPILHLTPRPLFRVRTSKTRPAPRIMVEISRRVEPHEGNAEGVGQGVVFEGGGSTRVGSGGRHCEGQTALDHDEVAAAAASGGGMEDERMESLGGAGRGEGQQSRGELEGGVGRGQAGVAPALVRETCGNEGWR